MLGKKFLGIETETDKFEDLKKTYPDQKEMFFLFSSARFLLSLTSIKLEHWKGIANKLKVKIGNRGSESKVANFVNFLEVLKSSLDNESKKDKEIASHLELFANLEIADIEKYMLNVISERYQYLQTVKISFLIEAMICGDDELKEYIFENWNNWNSIKTEYCLTKTGFIGRKLSYRRQF